MEPKSRYGFTLIIRHIDYEVNRFGISDGVPVDTTIRLYYDNNYKLFNTAKYAYESEIMNHEVKLTDLELLAIVDLLYDVKKNFETHIIRYSVHSESPSSVINKIKLAHYFGDINVIDL
jgi:hypothetical protein